MAERWLYWVTLVLQSDMRTGLTGRMVESPTALNSEEAVVSMINSLTREYYTPEELEEIGQGELPLVPLNWVLVRAQRGPAVKPVGGNGKETS